MNAEVLELNPGKRADLERPITGIFPEKEYGKIAENAKLLKPGEKTSFTRIYNKKIHRVDFYPAGIDHQSKGFEDALGIYMKLSQHDYAMRFCVGGSGNESEYRDKLKKIYNTRSSIMLIYDLAGSPEAVIEATRGERSEVIDLGAVVSPECRGKKGQNGNIIGEHLGSGGTKDIMGILSKMGAKKAETYIHPENSASLRVVRSIKKHIENGEIPWKYEEDRMNWTYTFDLSDQCYSPEKASSTALSR